jgi:hypothetical protein
MVVLAIGGFVLAIGGAVSLSRFAEGADVDRATSDPTARRS